MSQIGSKGSGHRLRYLSTYHFIIIILRVCNTQRKMEGQNPYERKYKQLSMLGKGNYGKVYKVKLNNGKEGKDASYFVAKKMFLEGLSEQDIKSAYGEIKILQHLNEEIKKNKVPFLVGYEEFFRVDNELIIIMEYCEEGELSTYLKNLKKNGQRLDQKIIGYWFTQLLFGLRVLHSKNILHRDLKSANVFLTKNYSLKIGDFGISKVLEHSSAITCIGTPLYLSPEVCNNQPYGFSSDLWALGCILYEMCCLKYPFEASNMIVLAKKIVMDKVEAIPSYYDSQLNDIVMRMFQKDPKKRISASQIIQTSYFRKVAQNFLQDQGRIRELAIPIDVEQPKKEEPSHSQQEDTWKTINSQGSCTSGKTQTIALTHKERLAQKKRQEALKREEELKAHAAEEYKANQTIVQEVKRRNQTGYDKASTLASTQKIKSEMLVQTKNKAISELKTKQRKEQQSEMEKKQDIPLDAIFNTINNISIIDAEDQFEEVLPLPGNSSYVPISGTMKKTQKQNVAETIKPKKEAEEIKEEIIEGDYDEDLQEYYDDDFQEYEEPTSAKKIEMKRESEDIVSYFQNQLNISTMEPTRRTMVQQALKPLNTSTMMEVVKSKEAECLKLVGQKRYKQLAGWLRQGKIDWKKLPKDTKYSVTDKKVLYLIEEMIELETR